MRINKICILFLAFFLVMVPVGVVAGESDDSANQSSEISETAADGDNLEYSDSKDNNPEEEEEETSSKSEQSEEDIETNEGSKEESGSISNPNKSSKSEDEIEGQLDSEKTKEESTYEDPQDSLKNADDESESNSESSLNINDQSDDSVTDQSKDEETDEAKKQSQINSLSIKPASTGLPYKVGDRVEEIIGIKEKLNALGFSGITVTNYFGNYTEDKVLEFQRYYELSASGEVNRETLDKLNKVFDSPHQLGKRAAENKNIKEKLNAIGYGGIRVTDYFGDYTEKRVKEFQRDHNLKDHGIVDSKTMAKLNEVYNSAIRPGQRDPILLDVKKKLNSLGFGGIIVSEYYGDYTAKRVKEFQSFADIPSNGALDKETLTALDNLARNGYSVGDRHSYIASMKRKLNRLDFSGIRVTTYYGNFTKKRVKEFQEYYDLKVTGRANQATLDQLNAVYDSSLQTGESNSEVRKIKKQLNAIGYDGIKVTNYFGDFTEKRVKEFQSDYGLKSHGIIDVKTLESLDEVYNSVIKPGDSDPILISVKEKLNSLGFNGIVVTEYYGNFTERRVKEFQRYVGISATGLLNEQTITELDHLAEEGYSVGDRHSIISSMKRKLNSLGFSGILVTNYYGDFTKKKIKEFQKYYEIPVTGKANKETLDKLDTIYNYPLQLGKSHSDLIEIKEMLNTIGFGGIIVSNYFGNFTEKRVKQFQLSYGLKSHGIIDKKTQNKIEEAYYSSAIWPGESNPVLVEVKEKLNSLGFGGIIISSYYGNFTEKRVKEFQEFAKLPITGALGERTITALNQLAREGYKVGDSHTNIAAMKKRMNTIGFKGIKVTNYFGSYTESKVKEFQQYYGLQVTGKANKETLDYLNDIYNHPYQVGKSHPDIKEIKQMLNLIGYNGITVTNYFGGFTERRVKEFQADYDLVVSGIVEPKTLNQLEKVYEASTVKYNNYNYTFNRMVELQMKYGTPKYDGAGKVPADEANVRYYLNPSNFTHGTAGHLQFLLLDKSANVSAAELNEKYLKGKGKLEGTGSAFIQAGNENSLNEFYLMTHALHETDNGKSTLSLGVGVDEKGNIIRDSNGNIIRDINHKDVAHIVYNFYGYGAHDNNPLVGGVKYGYEREWFTPESAVIGGAKNISNNYISKGQNTLYKMKWDPDHVEENDQRGRQYATHIKWAVSQAKRMFNMLGSSVFESLALFEIPQYENQPEADSNIPPAPKPDLPPTVVVNDYPADTMGKTTANVNFRRGPSTSYEKIMLINGGTKVNLIGDNNGQWVKAQLNGIEGWIHRDYVESPHLYEVYATGNVNYRATPAGERKGALSGGDLVTLSLDKNNNIVSKKATLDNTEYNWVRIRVNGNDYWIADNFLRKY
uniref:peptidoglycan-binding protein n=1 Tax=uncultured Allobacillus sp. TaxID=1638025 RepID=UPI002594B8AE|nr:peptidoglycan-binding protein [uncultured Allobacillus sp.]